MSFVASPRFRRSIKRLLKRHPERSDPLAVRANIAALIRANAEGGRVAIVYGFRDCDGCESTGNVGYIPAIVSAYLRAIDRLRRDAEGPVWYGLEKPSVAYRINPGFRDLAMEAYENGHPHVIYSSH